MSQKWRLNLHDALLLDTLILIHGNCKDLFLLTTDERQRLPDALREVPATTLETILALQLEASGADVVLVFDPVEGVRVLRGAMQSTADRLYAGRTDTTIGGRETSRGEGALQLPRAQAPLANPDAWMVPLDIRQKPLDFLKTVNSRFFSDAETNVGVICQFVDRYLPFSDRQDPEERQISIVIQKAAIAAWNASKGGRVGSRLLLLFDMEGQIPQELNTLFPFARSVFVPPPSMEDRESFFAEFFANFDSGNEPPVDLRKNSEYLKYVSQQADGLRMQDLFSLAKLSRSERLGLSQNELPQLLSRFKFGTRENLWSKVSTTVLSNAAERLTARVKGQSEVINEVVPVLMRAKMGMTDIAGTGTTGKPRGVFFFVGPTGVGKTELSKAIAELIFGNEQALLRFDMSEYAEEHQQSRFVGSPPGYVGFDQGGQLTNAVNERPFSVLLFDEIEKAHGRILDKFLQILDDGRLTDGMGKTVYFSESLIIFTSNIGARPRGLTDDCEDVTDASIDRAKRSAGETDWATKLSQLPYPDLCDHFRNAVRQFFINDLGRPEILNRIGEENILVFRFLTDERAKIEIIDQLLKNMQRVLFERHQVSVSCTPTFRRLLLVHPGGFNRNGARGVRNLLNRFVLNRIAPDLLLQGELYRGQTLRIDYEAADEDVGAIPFDDNLLMCEWILP
jgi:hypothetical protein